MQIKLIEAKDTYSVRHPVLRQGKPIESCSFPGDSLNSTFHFGLHIDNKLVGVCSLFKSNNDLFNEVNQYQLRGMAILESYQGNSYGNTIVNFVETFLKNKEVNFLWCNAREKASPFYKKNHFNIISKPFNIKGVGLHFIMYKHLK